MQCSPRRDNRAGQHPSRHPAASGEGQSTTAFTNQSATSATLQLYARKHTSAHAELAHLKGANSYY